MTLTRTPPKHRVWRAIPLIAIALATTTSACAVIGKNALPTIPSGGAEPSAEGEDLAFLRGMVARMIEQDERASPVTEGTQPIRTTAPPVPARSDVPESVVDAELKAELERIKRVAL